MIFANKVKEVQQKKHLAKQKQLIQQTENNIKKTKPIKNKRQ